MRKTYKDTHILSSARRGLSAIKVPHTVRIKTVSADGRTTSFHNEVTHVETAELELWINVEGLFRALGNKAVRSTGRVAKLCNGLVRVQAVNIKKGVA